MIYTVTLNPAVDRELVVPAMEFDTVLRAVEWRVDCGGKGFNVSRMLKGLETGSTALGFAGGDSGRMLEKALHALEIDTDFVWVDGETRTNVSIVTVAHDHYIKVNEPGPTVEEADLRSLLAKISDLGAPGDWWVLSGSLPPGVPSDYYAQLIELIHESGGSTLLDVSGPALRHGCEAGPLVVKPNEVEAHALTGMPVDTIAEIVRAAAEIRRMGSANVIVSLGKDGALLVTEDGAWQMSAPPIEERNPIGAGDSLVGGVVWGLVQGLDLRQSLRWGIACGAATASLSGTAVGDRRLVESLLQDVGIETL